jgi:hypothetical protein
MPAETRGSVYKTRGGYGIRWPEDGKRKFESGFANKTDARRWFAETVAPRLRRGAPSAELSFDSFCDVFLDRHVASERTKETLKERLVPSRKVFGSWSLRELEGGADDIAAWRAKLAEGSRYRLTSALRQTLAAAQRWGYIARNPAVDAGSNLQPRATPPRPGCARTSGRRSNVRTSIVRDVPSPFNVVTRTAD